jgi:hypothetical protein
MLQPAPSSTQLTPPPRSLSLVTYAPRSRR